MATEQVVDRAVLVRKACEILAQKGEPYPFRDLFKDLEASVTLAPGQLEPMPRRPDYRRFELELAFTSANESRAGWLTKGKGLWSLTDAGREALDRYKSPEEFHAEASRLPRPTENLDTP